MNAPKTIMFHGKPMTAAEIVDWVSRNRDYTLTTGTILWRARQGLKDDDLVVKELPTRRVREVWPQKLVRVSVPGWGVRV